MRNKIPATNERMLIAKNAKVSHVTFSIILKTTEQTIEVMNNPTSITEMEITQTTFENVAFFADNADKNKTKIIKKTMAKKSGPKIYSSTLFAN